MRIELVCKRRYTNKDLIDDRFGRLYQFPKHWVKLGCTVQVLAADYFSFKTSHYISDDVFFKSMGFPSLGFDYLLKLLKYTRHFSPGVIVASGDSHFGYMSAILARHFEVPFVFDLYHHYADFKTNRLPGMKTMYFHALRQADLVVCDSEPLAEKVRPFSRRVHVATQGTDTSVFYPLPQKACREALGLPQAATLIGYTGSLDKRFDADAVIGLMKRLRTEFQDVYLVVAGLNLIGFSTADKHTIYLGQRPQSEVVEVINACDIMLIPYNNSDLARTSNPCKLSEYMACKKPIVASDFSNIRDYLSDSANYIYNPGDVDGLYRSTKKQLVDKKVETLPERLVWSSISKHYFAQIRKLLAE